jgi:ribosomal-protein-alanine N-acetyltransferase
MNIRNALTGEEEAIAQIDDSHRFSAHWSAVQVQGEMGHPCGRVLVAETDGKISGFIAFRAVAGVGEILNLAVAQNKLRCHLGTLLVERALKEMRESATLQITLEVNENNLPAITLYEKAGFKVIGRRPKFYNGAEDALLMGLVS